MPTRPFVDEFIRGRRDGPDASQIQAPDSEHATTDPSLPTRVRSLSIEPRPSDEENPTIDTNKPIIHCTAPPAIRPYLNHTGDQAQRNRTEPDLWPESDAPRHGPLPPLPRLVRRGRTGADCGWPAASWPAANAIKAPDPDDTLKGSSLKPPCP